MSSSSVSLGQLRRVDLAVAVLGAAVAAVAVAVLAGVLPPILVLGAALVGGLAVAIAAYPEASLLVMICVRAPIEVFGDVPIISLGSGGLALPDLVSIVFVVGASLSLLRAIRRRAGLLSLPLVPPMLLFSLLAMISVAYSVDPIWSARTFVKVVSYLLAFVMVLLWLKEDRVTKALWMLLLSSVVPIAVGITQFLGGEGASTVAGVQYGSLSGGARFASVFDHPNTYGLFLTTVVAAAWVLSRTPNRVRKWLALTIGAVAFFSVFLTGSRSALLVLATLCVVIGWKHRSFFVLIAVGSAVAFVLRPEVFERVMQVFADDAAGSDIGDRVVIWSLAVPLIAAAPLTGHGFGTFSILTDGVFAHNDYAAVFVETGVSGILAFVWLIVALVAVTVRAVRRSEASTLAMASLALAVSYAVVSAVTNSLEKSSVLWYVWVMVALSIVASRTARRDAFTS